MDPPGRIRTCTEKCLTRRDVLLAGGAAALGTLLMAPLAQAATTTTLLSGYRRAAYLGLTKRRFSARPLGSATDWFGLDLVEVADLPRAATLAKYRGADNAFGLVFTGPPGPPEGIYRLVNRQMLHVDLFLTPGETTGGRQRYGAVVDRMYKPTARTPAPRPGNPRRD